MNLTKYLKGCTTITELEQMPNSYSHTIYKQYVEFLKSEEAQKARASEEVVDAMEDGIM